ncbi:26S proteasome non-ATPase regulatory subunit 12-like [Metopolophium dirhodum]|uniref:26S proteasome non-ATPase regulatory subunit 12-like n=1 Tax=Metopolophium dirhodum TaxID=44670 RepID=UPI00298FEDA8|nr:26S proteasome non-ATPase regulatory subunit 12-like [Metopolophium dirhodum]
MNNFQSLNTDGGRTVQMNVDFSAKLDETIPVAESLAASGNYVEALAMLFLLKNQVRKETHINSTIRLFTTMRKIYSQVKDKETLQKIEIRSMIIQYWNNPDQIEFKETKLKSNVSPRVVTEGKICVESDTAQNTQKLAQNKEDEVDVTGATSITQELQVDDSMKTPEEDELLKCKKN